MNSFLGAARILVGKLIVLFRINQKLIKKKMVSIDLKMIT